MKNPYLSTGEKYICLEVHRVYLNYLVSMLKETKFYNQSFPTFIYQKLHGEVIIGQYYTQNPISSAWLQSLLLLSRFCTIKKRDEIKYVYLIPSSNDT